MDNGTSSEHYPASYLAESNGPQLLSVTIAFAVLNPLFLALFLTSRSINKTANGLDFWLMLVSFVFCIAHVPVMIVNLNAGAGRHFVAVTPEQYLLQSKIVFIEDFLYPTSIAATKLAVLALYMRLFATAGQQAYRWAVYALATIVVLNLVTAFLLDLLICQPISYNWDSLVSGGHCGDKVAAWTWISIPGIATDLLMLLLPIRVVWKLQTEKTTKIGLILTFLTGSSGMIAAIFRFIAFFNLNSGYSDPTFHGIQADIWSVAEPGIYFIAASLMSLRPLVRVSLNKMNLTQISSRLRVDRRSKETAPTAPTSYNKLVSSPTLSQETVKVEQFPTFERSDVDTGYHRIEVERNPFHEESRFV